MSKEQKRDELTEIIIKASEEWLKLYGRQHLHLEHKAEHIAAAVNNAGYRKQSENERRCGMMVGVEVTRKLAHAFPQGYINYNLEFIAHEEANEYFRLEDCETEFDVKCKVLEWLSQGAYKACPFNSDRKNERFHNFMLKGINDFLGTAFTEDDMEIIYTYLGNRCNHLKTMLFVECGYNMTVLKGGE